MYSANKEMGSTDESYSHTVLVHLEEPSLRLVYEGSSDRDRDRERESAAQCNEKYSAVEKSAEMERAMAAMRAELQGLQVAMQQQQAMLTQKQEDIPVVTAVLGGGNGKDSSEARRSSRRWVHHRQHVHGQEKQRLCQVESQSSNLHESEVLTPNLFFILSGGVIITLVARGQCALELSRSWTCFLAVCAVSDRASRSCSGSACAKNPPQQRLEEGAGAVKRARSRLIFFATGRLPGPRRHPHEFERHTRDAGTW